MTCPACNSENRSEAVFCVGCGAKLEHAQEIVYPETRGNTAFSDTQPATKKYAQNKNTFVAVMLSFCPGLGQAYNNDWKKMFALWLSIPVLIVAAGTGIGIPVALIVGVALYLWSIMDAYRVAKREKALW